MMMFTFCIQSMFHSKLTVYTDYEYLSREAEFNTLDKLELFTY